jgi:hypothetical protein
MPNSGSSEALARAYIRRESLDIYNRLHSIEADIAFVNQVRTAYPTFPIIRIVLSFLCRLLSPPNTFHTNSKSPLRCLVHRSCYCTFTSVLRVAGTPDKSDDVWPRRRIPLHTHTSRVPMAITATGLSTFVARICTCYLSSPLMAGTSPFLSNRYLLRSSGGFSLLPLPK